MQYCEYCGKPIDDNSVFCSRCGTNLQCGTPIPYFCRECGDRIVDGMDGRRCIRCGFTVLEAYPAGPPVWEQLEKTKSDRKKTRKRLVAAALTALAVLIVVLVLCGGTTKRAEFPSNWSSESLSAFLQVMCENMDTEVTYDVYQSNEYVYHLNIRTERTGVYPAFTFYERRSDSGGRPQIKLSFGGRMPGLEDPVDIKGAYNLSQDIAQALERTLSGKEKILRYVGNYSAMQKKAAKLLQENPQGIYDDISIAKYWLTDTIFVEVVWTNVYEGNWHIKYTMTFTDQK